MIFIPKQVVRQQLHATVSKSQLSNPKEQLFRPLVPKLFRAVCVPRVFGEPVVYPDAHTLENTL